MQEKTKGKQEYVMPEELLEEQQPFACWLQRAGGMGGRVWKEKLLEAYRTPGEVYRTGKDKLEKVVGAARAEMLVQAQKEDVYAYEENMREKGIFFYPFYHPAYPRRLKQIPDRPFGVYVKGHIREDCGSVAIIGARDCSAYGTYVAQEFGRVLSAKGNRIVSGMARGIDGMAQAAALEAGGNTCAVLGCGVDVCYPSSNRELYERICEKGSILSEYPPGTKPHAALFPARNRIISGLSDLVLVVEARQKSGTLITVDMALEQGKEVFVVPGRITDRLSDGCNWLLMQGASAALSPAQLLGQLRTQNGEEQGAEMSGKGRSAAKKSSGKLTEQESALLSLMDFYPVSIEQLRIEMQTNRSLCGLSLSQTYEKLFWLEEKGYLKQEGGFVALKKEFS